LHHRSVVRLSFFALLYRPSPMAERWDAGDMACGELILELRGRLAALSAGETIELVVRDPGAPEDLPAWCRLTGHTLLQARPPTYVIERREGA